MSSIKLVEWQKKCLDEIADKNCVILASPTGSGKTTCYEEWAFNKKERPIFITAPIKALSNQRYRDLSSKGYKVALETGDVSYFPDDCCDIICCTQEIYNYKYRNLRNTTVIIDEFSYIYDDIDRARAYIDSLIYSKATNIMLCSATFGNPTEVLDYIRRVSRRDFYLFENSERLTELEYKGLIGISGIRNSFIVAYSKEDCYLLAKKLYQQRIDAVMSLSSGYDPRNRFRGKIKDLANKYEIKNNELIEFALMGVVYYCGKLYPKEKLFVEELLEHRYVDSVVGTNALALGVNFPIESVVFSGLRSGTGYKNPNGSGRVISKNLFEQLSGRAGRKKYFDKGYVYFCNDFYGRSLDREFWNLVKRPNEDFRVVLGSDIKAILSGEFTVEEDSWLRTQFSTIPLDMEAAMRETQEKIDFIKNLDITTFYFKKVYGIDITSGFYQAISSFSSKRQQELEKKSIELVMVQDLFEQDISEVYMSEYPVVRNCVIFIDVLTKTPLDKLLRINCYSRANGDYDVKSLLDFRKYMNRLPEKYSRHYDLATIDNLINSIDPTVLTPHRYVANENDKVAEKTPVIEKAEVKEKSRVVTVDPRKRFDIIEYRNHKYVKMMVDDAQILLCDYTDEGNLQLNYIPLRSIYNVVGFIGASRLAEMWPRIDFSTFGELEGGTSGKESSKRFEQLLAGDGTTTSNSKLVKRKSNKNNRYNKKRR